MTNKIFAMNESTITTMNNFFDRMLKSMNIRAKNLIVNKKGLNIEQHFHDFVDEIRDIKINLYDDYDEFEVKMKHNLSLINKELLTRLLNWINEKMLIYFLKNYDMDMKQKFRLAGKVHRVVLIKICYDTEFLKRMTGM